MTTVKLYRAWFGCVWLSLFYVCCMVFLLSNSYAAEASFSWLPNNDEVTTGYEIHYGHGSRQYDTIVDTGNPAPVDGRVHYTVNNIPAGVLTYFAALAYDAQGNKSDYSTEVSAVLDVPVPQDFRIESVQ